MKIKINQKEYEANVGETVLDVCRREGIRIPTLCSHGKFKREADCRLCLVEVNMTRKLVPSCVFPVCDKLEVITESENIKMAREINMELLWSDHAGKCAKCRRNRHCELQKLAEDYKIDNFKFVPRIGDVTSKEELDLLKDNRTRVVVEDRNPAIHRTTEFCVECRRCVNICPTKQYAFNNRSGDVVVGTAYDGELDCIFCGACVKHCPTAALTDKGDMETVEQELDDIETMAVAVVDPAVMESVAFELPRVTSVEKLVGMLRLLGFEKVFSLGWGMEAHFKQLQKEVLEARRQRKKQPVISSHCPSLGLYVKKYFPSLSSNISRVKNPDELVAQHIKTDYSRQEKIDPSHIKIVSISSCVAKKAVRSRNIDHLLTVRELGKLARRKKLENADINVSRYDEGLSFDEKYLEMSLFGGLGRIFDEIDGKKTKIKAANTMNDIDLFLAKMEKGKEQSDVFEGMVCPGGCVRGGGQSIQI